MIRINTSLLNNCKSNFSNEKESFSSSSYSTFSSSYIKSCSDSVVIRMSSTLQNLYENIIDGYNNIFTWLGDYSGDVESLERALSNDGRSGTLKEGSLRNYINANLCELNGYEVSFADVFNLNFENRYTDSIGSAESVSNITNNKVEQASTSWWEENVVSWWDDTVVPFWEDVIATGATLGTGVVEGLAKAGELFLDGMAMLGNSMSAQNMNNAWAFSPSQLQIYQDTIEFNNEATKAFVETDYVTPIADKYYEETEMGKWQQENAFWFDETREVGKGIGQTVGTVALSFGGSPVATAAVIGMGKGSEQAYQSGADFYEGAATGLATATWEGTQWLVGSEIGKLTPFENTKIPADVLNSLFRVGADAIDGAVEGFAQPVIESIYKDGYYDELGNYVEFTEADSFIEKYGELFDDAGGWANVGIQGTIGAIGSFLGEVSNLNKWYREQMGKNSDIETKVKVDPSAPYVVPTTIQGLDKYANMDELYQAYIKGKTGLNMMEYADAASYFNVRDKLSITNDIGQKLEDIFFDDNYVIGVHRVGLGDADSIMQNGLYLTGHQSSGVVNNVDIDLKNNVSFYEDYPSFLKALSEGSLYKRGDAGFGDAVIIKIPKSEIDNIDSLVDYSDMTPILKPEYVQGKVTSHVDENGKIKLDDITKNNDNLGNINSTSTNEVLGEKEVIVSKNDKDAGMLHESNKEKMDVDVTEKMDVDVTEKMDVDVTEKMDVDVTEKMDVDVTEKIDVDATEKMDVDVTEKIVVDATVPMTFIPVLNEWDLSEVNSNVGLYNMSLAQRFSIIKEFQDVMKTGYNSDQGLIDLLVKTIEQGDDNGFKILDTLIQLKKNNPNLSLRIENSCNDSYWQRNINLLVLGFLDTDWQASGTLAHELGHCLYDLVLGGKLPDNWNNIVANARDVSSNNGTLNLIGRELQDVKRDTNLLAIEQFEKSIMDEYGFTVDEYRNFLANKYGSVYKNGLQLYDYLAAEGYPKEVIYKLIDSSINNNLTIMDFVDVSIREKVSLIYEQINATQFREFGALSDIIDAVYGGAAPLRLTYGHGSDYYAQGENFAFHEIIANFTSLKLNNDYIALEKLKNIFGTEFYGVLESTYNQFLNLT